MKLLQLGADDLIWPRSDEKPYYKCGAGSYGGRGWPVDPYPAYTHDMTLVREQLEACAKAFPLSGARVEFAVLGHEFVGRTNGLACEDVVWRRADGTDWDEEYPHLAADWSGPLEGAAPLQPRRGGPDGEDDAHQAEDRRSDDVGGHRRRLASGVGHCGEHASSERLSANQATVSRL